MATQIIKIKRSSGVAAPPSLAQGELAYTYGTGTQGNLGDRLFIGTGTETNGIAANIDVIGGKYFTDKLDHAIGTLTASSALIVDENKAINELFVGNSASSGGAIYFKEGTNNGSNSIALKAPNSISSDIIYTLPASYTSGQFLKVTSGGVLEFAAIPSGSFNISGDDSSADTFTTGETLSFTGSNGINTSVGNNTVNISIDTNTIATKTYVDNVVANQMTTFTIVGDDSVTSTITQSDTLRYTGGTGISTAVSGDEVTFTLDNTAVSAGTYGSSTAIPTITVDAQGRITSASTTSISTDLTISSDDSSTGTITLGNDTLTFTGGTGISSSISGDAVTFTLEDTAVSAGSYGSSTSIPTFTVDAQGRITSASTASISTDLTIAADDSTGGTITLGSDTLTISGGTGINTSITGDTISVDVDTNTIATKAYVDSVAQGLDVKESVRVATTANLSANYDNNAGTLTASSNGAISIDGVALSVGDRVVVKDQTDATQNGLYKVTVVGSGSAQYVLTRTPDADSISELNAGAFFFVEEGTSNADNGYVVSSNTDDSSVLGSTDIVFSQFSGAGQISAGDGLAKTGNTLSVNVDDSTLEINSDTLRIKDGGISTAKIANSAVTNAKLANSTVTIAGTDSSSDDISLGQTLSITGGSVISATVASNTLTLGIEDGSIVNTKLANSYITISGADSGSNNIDLGDTLIFDGSDGVNVSVANNTVTVAVTEIDGGTF